MTDPTDELRAAHDVLADFYAERLAGLLENMPVERSVLTLFTELVRGAGLGTSVGDIGCGTGRLAPWLLESGLAPHGVDLSPEMVRVAQRDWPTVPFEVADLRALPFADASLAGAICWYSLMYLPPDDRSPAYAELARSVHRGGYVAVAFKVGDGSLRRGGEQLDLGIGFDIYWFAPDQVERLLVDAGFRVVFTAHCPSEAMPDQPPQGYVIAQRR